MMFGFVRKVLGLPEKCTAANGAAYTLSRSVGKDPESGKRRPAFVEKGCREWIKLHPTCAACGGTDHLNAHHVLPYSWPGGDTPENSDPARSPFITLCEHPSRCCHINDGHLGDFKSRNVDVRKDAPAKLAKRKNRPYPPK